jgi:hypothetical protein
MIHRVQFGTVVVSMIELDGDPRHKYEVAIIRAGRKTYAAKFPNREDADQGFRIATKWVKPGQQK